MTDHTPQAKRTAYVVAGIVVAYVAFMVGTMAVDLFVALRAASP